VQKSRAFSSKYGDGDDAADLDAARKWFAKFNENTIPMTISKTRFSNSSGPGGQKTNKTSSKATTVWSVETLKHHIPKILHPELRSSRYYVSSSDSFTIQSDVHRSQTENKDETRRRFNEEIREIYRSRVPGVTSPEQKAKVEQLKKAENAARLRMKKIHSTKKSARKGGSHGADF